MSMACVHTNHSMHATTACFSQKTLQKALEVDERQVHPIGWHTAKAEAMTAAHGPQSMIINVYSDAQH